MSKIHVPGSPGSRTGVPQLAIVKERGDASKIAGLGILSTLYPYMQEVVPMRKSRAYRATSVKKISFEEIISHGPAGEVTVDWTSVKRRFSRF